VRGRCGLLAGALRGLDRLPGCGLAGDILAFGVAEDVRMAGDHLVGQRGGHVVEVEGALLLGHAGVEHDLEEEVAQFLAQRAKIAAGNRVGHLVGFLDRVRRDGREVLLHVPGASGLRIPELGHDRQQT
jgi:hypothetical protein